MTYVVLYIAFIASIWWAYYIGWKEAIKKILSVLIPSAMIILFNIKAGRLIFKSPIVGIISILPTTIFIYRFSIPLVMAINSWIDRNQKDTVVSQEVVEAEVISKEDA